MAELLKDLFVNPDGSGTLAFLLFAAVVGIVIACACMLWQIKVPGRLVRTLSELGAVSESTAVDARKLGYKSEGLLRFLLSENGALRKYVQVIFTEKGKGGKGVFLTAKYHLKEDTKDRAELRYNKKNASTGALIAAIVVFSIAAVVLYFIIPDLIKMLENFLETLKGQE